MSPVIRAQPITEMNHKPEGDQAFSISECEVSAHAPRGLETAKPRPKSIITRADAGRRIYA
eukprot:5069876-Pyramimonas_sp.AAC.1